MHVVCVSCMLPGSYSTVLAARCTCSVLGWLASRPAAACPCSRRWPEPCRTSWPLLPSQWWVGRLRPSLERSPAERNASEAGPRTCLLEQRPTRRFIELFICLLLSIFSTKHKSEQSFVKVNEQFPSKTVNNE